MKLTQMLLLLLLLLLLPLNAAACAETILKIALKAGWAAEAVAAAASVTDSV